MNETRNLILALVLSASVLFGYNYFFPNNHNTIPPASKESVHKLKKNASTLSAPPLSYNSKQAYLSGAKDIHIAIESPRLSGSLSMRGGALNNLILKGYRKTTNPSSPFVDLLYPLETKSPYYANFGWLSSDQSIDVPNNKTKWVASSTKLTSESPLKLTYTNKQGVVFERIISIDDNYMFTIVQRIKNTTNRPISLYPYAFISQGGSRSGAEHMAYYVGPIGVINDSLKEVGYDDLKSKKTIEEESRGGWIGFTEKYWLSALIPDQTHSYTYEFKSNKDTSTNQEQFYQTSIRGNRISIPSGDVHTITTHFFAGAKEVSLLDSYEKTLNIPSFDRAVDFGWFYIITKPLFYTLSFLHDYISNMGLCILLLTVLIKLIFLPLANKSYVSMARMKKLQPKVKALQERYAEDKTELNKAMMELYKKEKVNPLSGCLPMIIQIPVFFGLYKVIFISLDMRHAPFFGWIRDLSVPDPTTIFNLFGLIPWSPPEFLLIGAWPLIMGVSMFLQQRMSPQPADPVQGKVMMALPVLFTFMFAKFPAGLVIYWTWNNVLSIAQQWFITKNSERKKAKKSKS